MTYDEYISRLKSRHGAKFSAANLVPKFRSYRDSTGSSEILTHDDNLVRVLDRGPR